jgi:hypothetical protein
MTVEMPNLSTVLAVLGILALAYSAWQGSAKSTIDLLNARIDILEKDKVADRAEIERLRLTVEVLSEQVSGASAVEALGRRTLANHDIIITGISAIREELACLRSSTHSTENRASG